MGTVSQMHICFGYPSTASDGCAKVNLVIFRFTLGFYMRQRKENPEMGSVCGFSCSFPSWYWVTLLSLSDHQSFTVEILMLLPCREIMKMLSGCFPYRTKKTYYYCRITAFYLVNVKNRSTVKWVSLHLFALNKQIPMPWSNCQLSC